MNNNSFKHFFVGKLTFFTFLGFMCCMLLSTPALKAKEVEKQNEPSYQIEVIVFEHHNKKGLHEAWPLEPGSPSVYDAKPLITAKSALEPTEDPAPAVDEFGQAIEKPIQASFGAYQELEAKDLQLNDAKERLKSSGSYRIIAHKGWRQPIQNKQEAANLRFFAGKRYESSRNLSYDDYDSYENSYNEQNAQSDSLHEIDGTIKISKSRYLHVATDLVFTKPMRVLTPASGLQGSGQYSPSVKLSNVRSRSNWRNESNTRLHPFRLTQNVRIRKNEVQYLDHPIFGVLVTVFETNT